MKLRSYTTGLIEYNLLLWKSGASAAVLSSLAYNYILVILVLISVLKYSSQTSFWLRH
jgi:hypothetical protein